MAVRTWVSFVVVGAIVVTIADGVRRGWRCIPSHLVATSVALVGVAIAYTPGVVFEKNNRLLGPCLGCHLLLVPAIVLAVLIWRWIDGALRRH